MRGKVVTPPLFRDVASQDVAQLGCDWCQPWGRGLPVTPSSFFHREEWLPLDYLGLATLSSRTAGRGRASSPCHRLLLRPSRLGDVRSGAGLRRHVGREIRVR